jgi:uncharacterized protein (DUF433 family)
MTNGENTSISTESVAAIVRTPGTCGGKPRIAGRRIRVQDVVLWRERLGMDDASILREYPGVTMAEIAAALAYHESHRQEIEDDLKAEEADVEAFFESLPEAHRFPRKADAQVDPISPR